MYSYDIIAKAVRNYWRKNDFAQDVVIYFWQKYVHEKDWEWREEVVFCDSADDYDTFSFLNDFCEGQSEVRIVEIVPLTTVIHDYHVN